MVSVQRVRDGMTRFIEQEICSKISGWQKFAVATASGLIISRMDQAVRTLPLGLSSGDMVDVEAIYQEAIKHIDAPIAVAVPGVGSLSLGREDLDTLYRMIVG